MSDLTQGLVEQLEEGLKKATSKSFQSIWRVLFGDKRISDNSSIHHKGLVKFAISIPISIVKGTSEGLMEGFREVTTNPHNKYKVNIDELRSRGAVVPLNDAVSKDLMKYFEPWCQKFGVKYSVCSCKDNYIIFMSANDAANIDKITELAMKDYEQAQKEKDAHQVEKTNRKKQAAKKKSNKKENVRNTKHFLDSSNGSIINFLENKNAAAKKMDQEHSAKEKVKKHEAISR